MTASMIMGPVADRWGASAGGHFHTTICDLRHAYGRASSFHEIVIFRALTDSVRRRDAQRRRTNAEYARASAASLRFNAFRWDASGRSLGRVGKFGDDPAWAAISILSWRNSAPFGCAHIDQGASESVKYLAVRGATRGRSPRSWRALHRDWWMYRPAG